MQLECLVNAVSNQLTFDVSINLNIEHALRVESRHTLLCQAELIRTEIETFLRFRVGRYGAALLRDHVFQYVLKRGVAVADHLDLIVVATCTPDQFLVSEACLIQAEIGGNAGAFDLGAACSGFVYAQIAMDLCNQGGRADCGRQPPSMRASRRRCIACAVR